MKRVTLFTKETCGVCKPFKYIVKRVQKRVAFEALKGLNGQVPFAFEEVHIDEAGNEKWFELYKYDIPVLHVEGEEFARHGIKERALLHFLKTGEKLKEDSPKKDS